MLHALSLSTAWGISTLGVLELPPSLLEVCYYSYFFTTYSTVYSYLCALGGAEGHTCGSQLLSLVVDKTYLRSRYQQLSFHKLIATLRLASTITGPSALSSVGFDSLKST